MWYLSCLFLLLALLSASAVVGHFLTQLLSPRVRPYASLAYCPLLGLAFSVLLASLVAWLGFGFKTWFCILLTAAVVALSAIRSFREDPYNLLRRCAGTSVFGIVVSTGILFSIARFEAFNPLNDAFTYLVHGQWLQEHPFREPAQMVGFPAATQVKLYQALHARMGASFLLGWVQAVFGLKWSYIAFPAVILLPLVAGAMAISGACRFATRGGTALCFLAGAAAATTLNGFSFGAATGFLPQTYGIAFAFGALTLFGIQLSTLNENSRVGLAQAAPVALLFAALVFCYPEFVPFVTLAAFSAMGVLAFRRPSMLRVWASLTGSVVFLVILLTNFELYRAVRSLLVQKDAVVGGPIVWTPVQFVAHAVGLLSGAWDSSIPFLWNATATWSLTIAMVAASALTLTLCSKRLRATALIPAGAVLAVGAMAFLYLRYFVASPWSHGVGQSWSQFKISNWLSPFALLMIACAAVLAARANRWARLAIPTGLLLWQAGGFAWNYYLADLRTRPFRMASRSDWAPFDTYHHLRRAVKSQTRGERLFLDLGGPHYKVRHLVSYFLSDHRLLSNWKDDDGYIFPWLPAEEQNRSAQPGIWTVCAAEMVPTASAQRIGGFALYRVDEHAASLVQVVGGHDLESDGVSTWHWTERSLRYDFKRVGSSRTRFSVKFLSAALTPGSRLRFRVLQQNTHTLTDTLALDHPHSSVPYALGPFEVASPEFSLEFQCDKPPRRIGPHDTRMASFIIKDLALLPVP